MAAWIRNPQHPAATAPFDHDARPRDEGLEIKSFMVKDAGALGVRRVIELKAAIEAITVDDVRANPPAHGVRALEHRDLNTVPGEMTCSSEAAQPGTHDHDAHGAQTSRQKTAPAKGRRARKDPVGHATAL